MADEAKLCNLFNFLKQGLCEACSGILVEMNWPFLLTNAGCRHCRFQRISLTCWAYFSLVMVFLGFRKLDNRSHGQKTTRQWPWPCFVFGKCFEGSYRSKHWAGPRWLSYRIHFSLHITIQLRNALLLCRVREDNASKQWFFFQPAHEVPTYWAFLPFQFASKAEVVYSGWHWLLQELPM